MRDRFGGYSAGTSFGAFGGAFGVVADHAGGDSTARAPRHYVFQRVHAVGGAAWHLPEHLELAARAFAHIYGHAVRPDIGRAEGLIAGCARTHHPSGRGGCTIILRFVPDDGDAGWRLDAEYERPLLEEGYAHSALRPRAESFEYRLPFGALPTSFQLSARELFDMLALGRYGATRSVRREGDRLVSCGESPIVAIRGRELVVPEGTVESVEAALAMAAAPEARLTVSRRPILRSELRRYDELMTVDAAGVTSLAECDGAKFMSLAAPRIAAAMRLI